MELTITQEKGNWYRIRDTETGPGEKEHVSSDRCFPTLAKNSNFLNIEMRVSPKHESKKKDEFVQKFMFAKYAVTKDELQIWNIDEEQLILDIRAKALLGEIDNASTPWRIVRLHDRGARLLKYFSERSKSTLFVPSGHFKRIS
jgi:hypothetical protein